jgi:predicted enzyme related to lactoylglutathione lyase
LSEVLAVARPSRERFTLLHGREREIHPMSNHGRFIWYELITTDLDGASRFYDDVVRWTHEDIAGPGMTYRVVSADGKGVGGMMLIPQEALTMGAPPSWSGYICVDDCDATAEKIKSLGGSVIRAPDDIPDIGRFAVVADPGGAVFEIMKPLPMDPPRPHAAPGTKGHVSWHELYAGGEVEASFEFYAELFGWKKDETMNMGPMGVYQLFKTHDGVVGGIMKKPDQLPRAGWLYYFQVGEIDGAVLRVTNGGGKVVNGPMEVPGGDWIIQGVDPQGAMFALVGNR